MPNNPKWRTIARISNQPLSLVQAVYLHLLVDASRNVTRGHAHVTIEDLASALDVTENQISDIFKAMQGRVLDGQKLTGWEKRQPKREDSGNRETGAKSVAERKRDERARKAEALIQLNEETESRNVTQCHAMSRNVTTDKDKDKDIKPSTSQSARARDPVTDPVTENPPEPKPPANQPDKFAMFVGWKPSEHVPDQARQANVSVDAATVVEFTAHWLTKPDDRRTQLEWDKALLKSATHNKLKNAGKPKETRSGGDGKIPVTGKFDRNSRIENYNREAAEARAKYEREQGINTSSERDITGECHIVT